MRGRKPKPTLLKLLHHSQARRINKREPQPEALALECPPEILEATAREEWARTIAPQIETGQITSADRSFAIAHCELWATWRSQLEDAARHAHVIAVGPGRRPTQNPARGMANKTLLLLIKIDAELGLTPTSRTRVQTATPKPRLNNPLAKFMKGAR